MKEQADYEDLRRDHQVLVNDYDDRGIEIERLGGVVRRYLEAHNKYFNSEMRDDGCPCLICKDARLALGNVTA